MRKRERPDLPTLKVVGPAADVERVVRLSMGLLQPKRFEGVCERPEVVPLVPGETFEAADFRVETYPALHPVQGLVLRFTDRRTGSDFAYSGDTAHNSGLLELVRGVPLLVHEASFGANHTPDDNRSLHSSALDAARVASEAGVGRLALVHCPEKDQDGALASARKIFPNTFWPEDGETVVVEAKG
jgi:ribonuclease BN (tRNA processing enzyme)